MGAELKNMIFPLDILEMGQLFAIIALVLTITSEAITPMRAPFMRVNKKKLKQTAILFAVLFILTVTMELIRIIFRL